MAAAKLSRTSVALAFLALTACVHTPPSVITPQGKTAYTADQVAQRVQELENATIQAADQHAISVNTGRIIVQWCVNAAQILKAAPAGWQSALAQGWSIAKVQIPAADLANPIIAASIGAVDVVLAAGSS